MTEYVRSFRELAPEQRSFAGGKGGTLARLYQAGYPVPDGFVILPAAFAGDQLTPAAWAHVLVHLARLRGGKADAAFAVRSSALCEDSPRASFAGEFETVLDVCTDEQVRDAIQAVCRSRLSERVQAYSQARGMDPAQEMAVVVQRLLPAILSGVLFTADPLTGSRTHMRGNYVHGLGDRLVSGQASGEPFAIERPGGRYEGAPELKPVARRLFRLASQLEQELGGPQDVEWAVAGRRLHLLQSRPITTLVGHDPATGEWNESLTDDFLWSNVNLGEAGPSSFPAPGPSSPTWARPSPTRPSSPVSWVSRRSSAVATPPCGSRPATG
jgi:phosphoenolpyruvate synthase/pyruvate phosphate dikinase